MDVDVVLVLLCGSLVLSVVGLLALGLLQRRVNKGHAAVRRDDHGRG